MAQAFDNLHTRRGFSKFLAAASAAAALPVPAIAAPQVSQELLDAADKLKAANLDDDKAFEQVHFARVAVAEWKAQNVEPDANDPKYGDLEIAIYQKSYRKDRDDYINRETKMKFACGLGKAQQRRNSTLKAWEDAAFQFSDIECASMQDVLFKAKMAATLDTDKSPISTAIVYDLLQLHKIDFSDI